MTTICWDGKRLSADSRATSRSTGQTRDVNINKIKKAVDITIDGVPLTWFTGTGKLEDLNMLASMLGVNREVPVELKTLLPSLTTLKYSNRFELYAMFITEDGGYYNFKHRTTIIDTIARYGVDVVKGNLKPGNVFCTGSGATHVSNLNKNKVLNSSTELIWAAGKLDNGTGGEVVYVTPKAKKISVYKGPNETVVADVVKHYTELFTDNN